MNTKGRQAKSKARLARYDSLSQEDEAAAAAARASLESIFIPPGPALGTTVVEAKVGIVKRGCVLDGHICGNLPLVHMGYCLQNRRIYPLYTGHSP